MSYDRGMVPVIDCPTREPLRRQLERRLKDAEERVTDLKTALKFLDDNSGFEAFHDLIGKVGF